MKLIQLNVSILAFGLDHDDPMWAIVYDVLQRAILRGMDKLNRIDGFPDFSLNIERIAQTPVKAEDGVDVQISVECPSGRDLSDGIRGLKSCATLIEKMLAEVDFPAKGVTPLVALRATGIQKEIRNKDSAAA